MIEISEPLTWKNVLIPVRRVMRGGERWGQESSQDNEYKFLISPPQQSPINLLVVYSITSCILWCKTDPQTHKKVNNKNTSDKRARNALNSYVDEASVVGFYDYVWMTDDYVTNFHLGASFSVGKTTRRWNEVLWLVSLARCLWRSSFSHRTKRAVCLRKKRKK